MAIYTAPLAPTHQVGDTRFTSLATPSKGTTSMSMWTVEIPPGTPPTPHSLTVEETFVVTAGTARLRLGGIDELAAPGDVIVVPPEQSFELSNASDEPLRMICYLPLGGQVRLPDGTSFTPPWAE